MQLVGGLEHQLYFPMYWECHHPNWLSYFSEGWLKTTNQLWFYGFTPDHVPDFCSWTFTSHLDTQSNTVDDLGPSHWGRKKTQTPSSETDPQLAILRFYHHTLYLVSSICSWRLRRELNTIVHYVAWFRVMIIFRISSPYISNSCKINSTHISHTHQCISLNNHGTHNCNNHGMNNNSSSDNSRQESW